MILEEKILDNDVKIKKSEELNEYNIDERNSFVRGYFENHGTFPKSSEGEKFDVSFLKVLIKQDPKRFSEVMQLIGRAERYLYSNVPIIINKTQMDQLLEYYECTSYEQIKNYFKLLEFTPKNLPIIQLGDKVIVDKKVIEKLCEIFEVQSYNDLKELVENDMIELEDDAKTMSYENKE